MLSKKLLTMKRVASILDVSDSFAYKLGREGQLPVVRVGRSVRVRESDLVQFINKQTVCERANVSEK